jgi:hypothetical protein
MIILDQITYKNHVITHRQDERGITLEVVGPLVNFTRGTFIVMTSDIIQMIDRKAGNHV